MTDTDPVVLDQPDAARVDPSMVWRGVLAVAAVLAAVAGLPSYVVGGLVVLALGAALERIVRRGRGGGDALLLGVGGVVVLVVLTGVVLRSASVGLTTTSWGVALGLVSCGCLAVGLNLPRPEAVLRRDVMAAARGLPWLVAVAVVAVVALGISASARSDGSEVVGGRAAGSGTTTPGGTSATGAPPLRMWIAAVDRGDVRVKVSAPKRTGPVLLRTTDANGVEIDYPLFTVPAGATYSAVVEVAETGRSVISLVDPDQTRSLRSLVLDR